MKTIETLFIAGTCALLGAFATAASAEVSADHSKWGETRMTAGTAGEMTDAEVRRVDKAQGRITLKHGEIKNLDMPAMTMVFTVKDPALLDGVKPGDKVKFKAVDDKGKLMVVEMTAVR